MTRQAKQAEIKTHNLLISLGFINVENTLRDPCYQIDGLPLLIVKDPIASYKDVLIAIYNSGFQNGEKTFHSNLTNFIANYERSSNKT